MDKKQLLKKWLQEEKIAHIRGWDFSHIHGRYEEENDLPWDYGDIIKKYLREEFCLLDMDTGGGEFLLSLLWCSINILENFRLLPLSQTFLPFVLAGGSALIVCYMLIGIILSIYRHKNIYPIHMDKIQNQLFSE